MKKISIKHLEFAYKAWLGSIDFYNLELKILEKRLEEIVCDNTGREIAERIEHFQNQLIIHKDYLDGLSHWMRSNAETAEEELIQNSGYITQQTMVIHDQLAEQFRTEEKMINKLRHEFNRFSSKWV